MKTGHVKLTADCTIGHRSFQRGSIEEVTTDEFSKLIRLNAAVPVGDARGGPMTLDRPGTDLGPKIGHVKVTADCTIGHRSFKRDSIEEVTMDEFSKLIRLNSAVPAGNGRGYAMTRHDSLGVNVVIHR